MKALRVAGVLAAGCAAIYYAILRRPTLTWGATATEAASRLPGDELLEDADGMSTRAIEIDAPASAVWPWLAQMGPSPRGGAYTYDWIENLLRLNMHSVDRVLPEFQHPDVGETMSLGSNRMRIERVEPADAHSSRSRPVAPPTRSSAAAAANDESSTARAGAGTAPGTVLARR